MNLINRAFQGLIHISHSPSSFNGGATRSLASSIPPIDFEAIREGMEVPGVSHEDLSEYRQSCRNFFEVSKKLELLENSEPKRIETMLTEDELPEMLIPKYTRWVSLTFNELLQQNSLHRLDDCASMFRYRGGVGNESSTL